MLAINQNNDFEYFDLRRIQNFDQLNLEFLTQTGKTIYWMNRDQRAVDNWALELAKIKSDYGKKGLAVVFSLVDSYLGATYRQNDFKIKGLEQTKINLRKQNIPFYLLHSQSDKVLSDLEEFINQNKVEFVISDFTALKLGKNWNDELKTKMPNNFFVVDAHNIVPVWIASSKQEFGAYTLRPKIKKLLPEFLTPYPKLTKLDNSWKVDPNHPNQNIDWQKTLENLVCDRSVAPVKWLVAGTENGIKELQNFITNRLQNYSTDRNNPNLNAQSNLSPFLHFGQISAQRVALEVSLLPQNPSTEAFLEELIIRRELADNFCFYNQNYDTFEGFPTWAKNTLNQHQADLREFVYNQEQFENADTHDPLWNSAQTEMVKLGKMHGFMRMYWAKKILEWTKTPMEAMQIAVYLNDKYSLDGRDSNGYTGIAWSIGGVHDRAWNKHLVYGMIRYMNYNGCKRKFDVKAYIQKFNQNKPILF